MPEPGDWNTEASRLLQMIEQYHRLLELAKTRGDQRDFFQQVVNMRKHLALYRDVFVRIAHEG